MSETTEPDTGDKERSPDTGDGEVGPDTADREPGPDRSDPELSGAGTDLVDLAKLSDWMDAQGLAPGAISDAEALAGGTQNLLLRFRRAGRTYVLRRGPRHLRSLSNDVMRREARVLQALAGSDVPHPAFVAGPGEPATGVAGDAVFYLMDPVDGFNPAGGLSPQLKDVPDAGRQIGLHMADAIAALGAVDHDAVGLADLGKPGNFLERQVPRWLGELDSYAELEGYPGPEIPHLDDVASWLDANRPTEWRPGILHGDFHLSNVMIANDRPEVAAIVDWEMCTIGDPLLDLGNMLGTWPIGPDGDTTGFGGVGGGVPGLPTPAEVVARRALRPRHVHHHLVHGLGLLQARHRAGRHPCPGLRGQGPQAGRRPAPRHHPRAVRPRPRRHRERLIRHGHMEREDYLRILLGMRKQARVAGLWLPHMPEEWGGMGLGHVELAMVQAEAAKSRLGPWVLNCQAPDEGNMHTLLRSRASSG
jgi:aminoglycoside phosphotransferase (APT) family kinase protein